MDQRSFIDLICVWFAFFANIVVALNQNSIVDEFKWFSEETKFMYLPYWMEKVNFAYIKCDIVQTIMQSGNVNDKHNMYWLKVQN